MIKPRQIERSSFILMDNNGQTRVYRMVSGPLQDSTLDSKSQKYKTILIDLCFASSFPWMFCNMEEYIDNWKLKIDWAISKVLFCPTTILEKLDMGSFSI